MKGKTAQGAEKLPTQNSVVEDGEGIVETAAPNRPAPKLEAMRITERRCTEARYRSAELRRMSYRMSAADRRTIAPQTDR
jgi:hypothetical protein